MIIGIAISTISRYQKYIIKVNAICETIELGFTLHSLRVKKKNDYKKKMITKKVRVAQG